MTQHDDVITVLVVDSLILFPLFKNHLHLFWNFLHFTEYSKSLENIAKKIQIIDIIKTATTVKT